MYKRQVWRYTIAVAMMVLLFRKQIRKVDRELLFEGAVLGLLLYISQCFQTGALGFADTTAGKVGFITSLYVVQVPLFSWIYKMCIRDRYNMMQSKEDNNMKKILISEWVPEECLKPYEGEFEFTVPSAEKHAFTYEEAYNLSLIHI